MKKLILLALVISIFQSCGSGTDGAKLAKEVCDCYKDAVEQSRTAPAGSSVKNDCMQKQLENGRKVENNKKKWDEFNSTLANCVKELGIPQISQ